MNYYPFVPWTLHYLWLNKGLWHSPNRVIVLHCFVQLYKPESIRQPYLMTFREAEVLKSSIVLLANGSLTPDPLQAAPRAEFSESWVQNNDGAKKCLQEMSEGSCQQASEQSYSWEITFWSDARTACSERGAGSQLPLKAVTFHLQLRYCVRKSLMIWDKHALTTFIQVTKRKQNLLYLNSACGVIFLNAVCHSGGFTLPSSWRGETSTDGIQIIALILITGKCTYRKAENRKPRFPIHYSTRSNTVLQKQLQLKNRLAEVWNHRGLLTHSTEPGRGFSYAFSSRFLGNVKRDHGPGVSGEKLGDLFFFLLSH